MTRHPPRPDDAAIRRALAGQYIADAAAVLGVHASTLGRWIAADPSLVEGLPRPSRTKRPDAATLQRVLESSDSTAHAADRLGVSRATLWRWRSRGR